MATVFIPAPLRKLTGGAAQVEVPGQTVREIVAQLESRFPGIAARLCKEDELAAGLAVSIGGTMSSRGLATRVPPDSEVHFLPAIGGG